MTADKKGVPQTPLAYVQHRNTGEERTVKFKDGSYQIKWPVKPNIEHLPSSYGLALGRCKGLVKGFKERSNLSKRYCDIIEHHEDKRVVEQVPPAEVYVVVFIQSIMVFI